MEKKITLVLIYFILTSFGFAQESWIDFDQAYYKIPTSKDGIHRISFTTLSASGIDPNSFDPRNIRMYHRGEEISVTIAGEQDGRFDMGDYIEFFGKRNDGTLDAKLYSDPSHVGNALYNTHNDSTAFFLTITPGVSGKRMTSGQNPILNLPISQFYESEYLRVFSDQYNLSWIYNPGTRLAKFEEGQGWMSTPIVKGVPRNIILSDLGDIAQSGSAKMEVGITGYSANPHLTVVSVGQNPGSLRELGRFQFKNFEVTRTEFSFAASDFNSDGSLTLQIASVGPEPTDNVGLAYFRLTYPKQIRNGDFIHETFIFDPGDQVLEINGVLANYAAFEISNPLHPQVIPITKEGNKLRFRAGLPAAKSKIWIENRLNVTEINVMRKVTFRNVLSQPADFIILTHKSLRRPTASYSDPVTAYAAHRASAEGGGYDTLVINIDELFDQFSFGEKSPLAVYEFLRKYYPVHKPEYLFLVGRSMGIFSTAREGNENFFYRKKPSIFSFQDLMPPAGYPYSDNNFTIGLDPNNPFVAAIPLGRLPARTSDQVASYLEKVKEKDALGATEPWQKEIVHLSGGVSAFELTRYFNFLNGFKSIAEAPYMGANVTTYRKRSNSTIELVDISGDVNRGTSLITFFGHGAPSIIDLEIGFASDPTMGYNNKGKYPILLLNGCDAGNAFGNAYTFGEDWVLTPSKGATNFLAHANVGVDIYLRRFSESIYAKAFSDSSMIYQTIGLVKKEAEKIFFSRYGTSAVNRGHTEQLVMLGDPAVRMFPANKPDYSLKDEEVTLESYAGETFNALADSLKLTFVVRNIGRADMDSVDFKINRRLPDGTTSIQFEPKWIGPVLRKDTIEFVIPNRGLAAFGENIFTLEINKSRAVEEMTYINNVITITRFIPLSGTINLLPTSFGIVNEKEIELFSQIPGKSVEERNLIIQMDTAADFSSASRREVRLTTANLARWKVNLFQNVPEKDSLTFYWRSRFLEPKPEESQDWTVSSFSYIKNGPEGWIQRQKSQLGTNQLDNLEIDPIKREWKYKDTKLNIGVFTFGTQADSLTFRNTQFFLNEVPYILDNVNNANSRLCPNGSLGLVAFEQKSLTPYLVIPVSGFDILDGRSCGRVPQVIQSVRNANITGPGQTMLIDYVNGLKMGDFVVIFSVGNVNFSDWPDAAFEKLKEVGANEATLRNLKTGDPYVLFGKKGMKPGEAMEIVSKQNIAMETNEQVIEFSTEMNGYFTSGSILTPRIGPSSEWRSFFNNVKSRDWFNEELAYFDVVGVRKNGEEQVLLSNIQEEQLDLTMISTELYPFLRLRYSMEDTLSTAPALLDKWQVNYTGVPEGVLIFKNKEKEIQLQEGQEATLNFEFINISTFDFLDSVTVEWEFNNSTLSKIEKFSKKIPAIKSGAVHSFSIDFNSIGRSGRVEVEVFANPRIFMEQTFRNNFIDLGAYFVVTPDNSKAILDVNFDGVYIMDGDIVSPTVLITALLKNDNTLILKKDTVGVELYLKRECEGCQFERMNFSHPKISWSAATENNSFEVELHPGPLADGLYTFRVVTADLGVDKPYEINFEVINAATITNFYPYPNPFSMSVRFVFTVTGSEVPDQIKIQIMTVTGRVIREILQDELGMVRIGNNISEYAWDGKDEFGDQLANGVYIYRVLVRKDGQFMEPRATAGDKGFKQGYGKMYLLR